MQVSLWKEWRSPLGLGFVFALVVWSWSFAGWAWQPQIVGGRCKQSGKRCSSTIGNAGGQGACCDPLRNAATCAKNDPCTGGSPYKWAESKYAQGLQWWVNSNNMAGQSGYQGLSKSAIIDAMKKGWDAWTTQRCTGLRHKYVGESTNFLSYQDRQNVIFLASESQWAQLGAGPSTLAFTRPVPGRNGILIDSDIAFNPRPGGSVWRIGNSTQRFQQDIIHVAAHEIGHAIGFGHSVQQKFLMYFASRPGPFPGLDQDDIDGLCFTYPRKNCSSDSDCGTCLSCQNKQCAPKSIPLQPKSCKPCAKPSDCGSPSSNICVRLQEGNRCAQLCNSGCCPKGYRCADFGVNKACIPDQGTCPAVTCQSDSNCGPGEQCSGGRCQPKPVTRNPKTCTACNSDSQCGGGMKCAGFSDGKGRCLQACESDNFCPPGFNCSSTLGGRYCTPANSFCPCTSDSQCLQGEACKAAVCRPAVCKYNCKCTIDGHCDKGYKCIQGQDGTGICAQPCGGSAAYPPGSPGGSCNNGQCSLGARCYQLSGNTICMAPCGGGGACPNGGRCFRLGGQSFCLCQGNSDCKSGQACNKSVLGQFGGGACAPASSNSQCEPGFSCKEVSRGSELCTPGSSGGPGGECGGVAGQCKDGLLCAQVQQGSSTGICFEDCSQTNQCKFGGQCILQAGQGRRFCGCQNQGQCKSGQTCKQIGSGVGVCTDGGTTPQCNNNKTCEAANGENCSNCADCACTGGSTCDKGICRSQSCGNGTCERDKLEDCGSCPGDCKCDNGKVCENSRCVPSPCGNGTCERDKLEDCGTCPSDCKCDNGKVCSSNRCISPPQSCGNGTCERDKLEDCGTCAKDCKCDGGRVCKQNRCVEDKSGNNNNNSGSDAGASADEDLNPPEQACGCHTDNGWSMSIFLWLGFLLVGLMHRRRRSEWY